VNSAPPDPQVLPPPDLDHPSAFLAGTGMRVTHVSPHAVDARVELGPQHHTPWGVVHGGLYTTVVESVASIGACAAVAGRGLIAVGVNNNTDFLRSMTSGTVTVHAEPVQQSRNQQLWDVNIVEEGTGRLVARGSVRLANVEPRRTR
jgi:1,4-dihydroxy-2-naphthoyl-CoA hydrolase